MILVPEIETVVLLTPRTGSGSLYRAVTSRYPKSILLYRHMEADGVPHGYDRWTKVGVVRDPFERLWSLYKFLQKFGVNGGGHCPIYAKRMRDSVARPFADWVLNNDVAFTTPYSASVSNKVHPLYTCNHPLPENRKSQFLYLRPDLGTRIYQYSDLNALEDDLDVVLERHNATEKASIPQLPTDAYEYISKWFAWDLEYAYK